MNKKDSKKIGIFIDGDNVDSSQITVIIEKIRSFGEITMKKIYGDWSSPHMKRWEKSINQHAIRPVHKYSYKSGKNSTDILLVIDVMDTLHSHKLDIFCIISSDNDFTGLAHRIREENFEVIGVGRKDTFIAFREACSEFIFIDSLPKSISTNSKTNVVIKTDSKRKNNEANDPILFSPNASLSETVKPITLSIVDKVFTKAVDKNTGTALLETFGAHFMNVIPGFSKNNYGHYPKFTDFCKKLSPYYELQNGSDGRTFLKKQIK